jgi:protein-tyrosine phosphatase
MNHSPRKHTLATAGVEPPIPWGYWVVEDLFLAGAYPGNPEPKKHERKIQTLLDANVRMFVNLMEPEETDLDGQCFAPYGDLVRQLCPEASCVRVPVQDQSTPTVETMHTILDTIDESLNDSRPVYVHCWGGVGRTGTVVSCWMLRHNLADRNNVLEVLKELRQQDIERRHRMSPETGDQERFVKRWRPT